MKFNSWKIAGDQLQTRWAKDINPDCPFPEYPRPQMMREEWMNLNGLWNYAITSKSIKMIKSFEGTILVPFAVESALSGVMRKLKPKERLWYQRTFIIPNSWNGKRILIHFGAIDWEATVWINGTRIGDHQGGNVPFSFDISEALHIKGLNEIIVSVWDPTNKGGVERGKQTLKPYGIKYNAMSGIWQTVWLEPVNDVFIDSLKIESDIDNKILRCKVNTLNAQRENKIIISILSEKKEIVTESGEVAKQFELKIPNVRLWCPDDPFLYDLSIKIENNGKILDAISSYFGMRKISMKEDEHGFQRILLNYKTIFQFGTLDQGYWPDGLYTAPTDEALKYDIEVTKELGFNLIRKHVKVESARWYYHCDKLGMLVWQDMPNGGKMGIIHMMIGLLKAKKNREHRRKELEKKRYYNELKSMINFLYNSPCIVVWVPFNEGWGQFDTKKTVDFVRELDSTRLIDSASGWHDLGVGDIADCHKYIGPAIPDNIKGRAAVCGEFGGLGLKIKGHMWKKKIKFVYRFFKDSAHLTRKYAELIEKLKNFIPKGLCAGIYTQLTDVEGEVNGLLTYDREVIKMEKQRINELNTNLLNNS